MKTGAVMYTGCSKASTLRKLVCRLEGRLVSVEKEWREVAVLREYVLDERS